MGQWIVVLIAVWIAIRIVKAYRRTPITDKHDQIRGAWLIAAMKKSGYEPRMTAKTDGLRFGPLSYKVE